MCLRVPFGKPRIDSRRINCGAGIRSTRGDFLIEALLAALIFSFVSGALVQMYVQVHQMGNMAQGQLNAAAISQEVIDNLRAQSFPSLIANLGTHNPQVNGAGLGSSTDALFPRPLLTDSTLDYTDNGDPTVSLTNADAAMVTCNPTTGAVTNTITVILSQPMGSGSTFPVQVAVTICWLDTTGHPRTFNSTSVIAPNGLNG
jgi:Tfp pilus assembly protein PilV